MRSLEERLEEYAKATRNLVPQLEAILEVASERPIVVSGNTPIKDAIRFYAAMADDLDKLVNGEELEHWRIEGII